MAEKTKTKKKIEKAPSSSELIQSASAYLVKQALEMSAGEMVIKHLDLKIHGESVGDWEVVIREIADKSEPVAHDKPIEKTDPKDETGIKSTDFYTLLMDERRNRVLGFLIQIALEEPTMKLVKALKNRGLEKVAHDLFREQCDKMHSLGWCEDPDCPKKK